MDRPSALCRLLARTQTCRGSGRRSQAIRPREQAAGRRRRRRGPACSPVRRARVSAKILPSKVKQDSFHYPERLVRPIPKARGAP